MKAVLFIPPALLLGLVIGGWAPKEELRAARRESAELREKLSKGEKESRMDAFTRMVQIPERAKAAKPAAASPKLTVTVGAASAGSTTNPPPASAPGEAPGSTVKKDANKPEALAPEDLRARIDEAKELWKTRVEIARAQWLERLKLTPEATAEFDAAINTMNEELYASMQNLADTLASGEAVTPEAGTRVFNEMTSALVKTYDGLAAIVPEAQRGEAAQMELTDFIDPGVAEPLIAVQDKLDNLPKQRGGPFGNRRAK